MAGFLTKALLDTIANSVAQAKDLNTLKDVLSRWFSNPSISRGLNLYLYNTTWSSGGDKIISGIGFKPSLVIVLACDTTAENINFSIGCDILTQHIFMMLYADAGYIGIADSSSFRIYRDASNYITGHFTSFNSDGGVYNITLVGTCAAEVGMLFIG